MDSYNCIISGGGSGGHIYPAIAIADEILQQYPHSQMLFVGALGKMEMQKVPEAGYKITGLPIRGLQRKLSLKNLILPIKLLQSILQSFRIIKNFKPHFVIGTGGYASFPMILAASLKGIPCFIQEQNFLPGIANRFLSKRVLKIFVAYKNLEKYFPNKKIIYTGNPIRKNILKDTGAEKKQTFFEHSEKKTVLVIGGSLGSKAINKLICEKVNFFKEKNIQVIWQCGQYYFDKYKHLTNSSVIVRPFIKNIDVAYHEADIIISRSGAMAISELSQVGKATILIPSPHVAEDHQTKNAQVLSDNQAAVLLKENEFDFFEKILSELLDDPKKSLRLSNNIKKMATPNAAKNIVESIIHELA